MVAEVRFEPTTFRVWTWRDNLFTTPRYKRSIIHLTKGWFYVTFVKELEHHHRSISYKI